MQPCPQGHNELRFTAPDQPQDPVSGHTFLPLTPKCGQQRSVLHRSPPQQRALDSDGLKVGVNWAGARATGSDLAPDEVETRLDIERASGGHPGTKRFEGTGRTDVRDVTRAGFLGT